MSVAGNRPASEPSVAVVIPTYNRAAYLRDALRSVREQTRPVDELIVVDDGSDDDTPAVVADFPGVTFIRQANLGPSAARNTGIHAATTDYVLCLDSDDVLVPTGIESSLACMAENPGVAFVYGAFAYVDEALRPIARVHFSPMPRDAYHALLQDNCVRMLGTVLFDRQRLIEAGGFDPAIDRSEDYDLYLRLARKHPVAGDPALVARYRRHGANLTARSDEMLRETLAVQERNRPDEGDAAGLRAYRRGKKTLARIFATGVWQAGRSSSGNGKWKARIAMARAAPASSLLAAAWQLLRRHLSPEAAERLKRALRRNSPQVGSVRLGDLARVRPISRHFGYDRGTPIDRWYIERFLARCAGDVRGRVLEVGDATYSRKFGTGITMQDVLHVTPRHPEATIVGDLSQQGALPEEAFDCLIVAQTLHLIFDLRAAVEQLWRSLRPGGVLLLTVPGVCSVDRGEWKGTWYWSLTEQSARMLFDPVFGSDNVEIEAHGNVYSATCFLQGLALEEIDQRWLGKTDPSYPMIVTVRARRAA